MDFLILLVMFGLFVFGVILYLRNIFCLVDTKWTGNEIKVILRGLGIFFPALGILMGFVPK